MKNETAKIIRWILEGILLVIVWQHSHWSVALALTLQGIAIEMFGIIYEAIKKER